MSSPLYNPPESGVKSHRGHYFWAFGVTIGIFILLPFTTYLNSFVEKAKPVTEAKIKEDPPVLLEDPEEEPEEEEQEDPPEMQEEIEPFTLYELQMDMRVGTGGFGPSVGIINFDALGPSMDEMIFNVSDLDKTPRVIKQGRLEYPFELKRSQIEGMVRLKVIIDERGRVRVSEVLDASHRDFVKAAVQAAEDSIFESPTRNGEKVKAYYILPIRFSLR